LSNLLATEKNQGTNSKRTYEVALGNVMLGLHKKNLKSVSVDLDSARSVVMEELASAARESYTRAYDLVVKLHILREVDDAKEIICKGDSSSILNELTEESGWGQWERRLAYVSQSGATSVVNARLALGRLAGDAGLEGSLFVSVGKRARKEGIFNIANNSFAQAEAAVANISDFGSLRSSLILEVAKLKRDMGETNLALRILEPADVGDLFDTKSDQLQTEVIRRASQMLQPSGKLLNNGRFDANGLQEKRLVDFFVECALQSTRWMMDGGLKAGAEIMYRFRTIHRIAPSFEKAHFLYAKYLDSVLKSRISALQRRQTGQLPGLDEDDLRSRTIGADEACQRNVLRIMEHYTQTLCLNSIHVYNALPRLLSLWFDFTSIQSSIEDREVQGKLMR
jgi:serine/threonine-protein kinase ATR